METLILSDEPNGPRASPHAGVILGRRRRQSHEARRSARLRPGLRRLQQRERPPRPGLLLESGRRRDSRRHVTSSQPPLPATQIRPRNPCPAGRAGGHVAGAPVPAAPWCVYLRRSPLGSLITANNQCFGDHPGKNEHTRLQTSSSAAVISGTAIPAAAGKFRWPRNAVSPKDTWIATFGPGDNVFKCLKSFKERIASCFFSRQPLRPTDHTVGGKAKSHVHIPAP
ncbi:PREDICTED: uncharacterized protein LOC105538681 [Mandrillus leucophaeus]|uniref:uncharacterized protein LOC105538681 n=1 Tax=Mandrillus leucophaeus TaxID=9568 RepID=UPI0005F4908D|nr:PREDICTED: uncharacterized protein LOC105538681 [Mandrillus leucophaeus]